MRPLLISGGLLNIGTPMLSIAVKVEKYSAFAIWPWCGDLNIAEMPFLKKSYY